MNRIEAHIKTKKYDGGNIQDLVGEYWASKIVYDKAACEMFIGYTIESYEIDRNLEVINYELTATYKDVVKNKGALRTQTWKIDVKWSALSELNFAYMDYLRGIAVSADVIDERQRITQKELIRKLQREEIDFVSRSRWLCQPVTDEEAAQAEKASQELEERKAKKDAALKAEQESHREIQELRKKNGGRILAPGQRRRWGQRWIDEAKKLREQKEAEAAAKAEAEAAAEAEKITAEAAATVEPKNELEKIAILRRQAIQAGLVKETTKAGAAYLTRRLQAAGITPLAIEAGAVAEDLELMELRRQAQAAGIIKDAARSVAGKKWLTQRLAAAARKAAA